MKIIRGVYCSVLNNGRGSGRYNAATEPAKIKRYFRVPGAGGGGGLETAARAGNNQRTRKERRKLESKGKKGEEGGGERVEGGCLPSRLFKFERLPLLLNEPTFMHYALARTKNPRGDTEIPGVERGPKKGGKNGGSGNRGGAQGERNSERVPSSLLRTRSDKRFHPACCRPSGWVGRVSVLVKFRRESGPGGGEKNTRR